jgi:hypothetical protein
MDEPPFRRLCCGQRHDGVQCPDGLVMCAICYNRVDPLHLNPLPEGGWENVCRMCHVEDRIQVLNSYVQDLRNSLHVLTHTVYLIGSPAGKAGRTCNLCGHLLREEPGEIRT